LGQFARNPTRTRATVEVADRQTSFGFYREALGLEAVGEERVARPFAEPNAR
jgi:hypothetical protein